MSKRSQAFAAAGATAVPLPPRSSDLNPIELAFSKLKWLLQSASARPVDVLRAACGNVRDCLTAADHCNCLKHCDYRHKEAGAL